ncbi:MAG: transaldolase family protein, partial [Tabrizicola sp.]|nr:transaldolase family protein [Tabrizicola sp.]
MKFFIDTADVDAIRELHDLGMVDGVTTNPSLILKSGRKLASIAQNISVNVPLTWDGLKTCKVLSGEGFMVNVTLCF